MKIDRVIVSTNDNPNYVDFWPLVAEAWNIIGIKPTLFLISEDFEVDTGVGEVIRVKPLESAPTALQAQCIRLIGPTLFPDEVCLLSDLDMMPLSREYFTEQIKQVDENKLVVFSSDAYPHGHPCIPMCYIAAKGKLYEEVFDVKFDDYADIIQNWYNMDYGWNTDERILHDKLKSWSKYEEECVNLKRGFRQGYSAPKRIDRTDMAFIPMKIFEKLYVDFHMPRPYSKYTEVINYIFDCFKKSQEI